MNYKDKIIKNIGIIIMFEIWYMFELPSIDTLGELEKIQTIVGTHSGYGYYLYISLLYMPLLLLMISLKIRKNTIITLVRVGRKQTYSILFKNILIDTFIFAFYFVMVYTVMTSVFVKVKILIKYNFYLIILLYFFIIWLIFLFGGCCYLLIFSLINKSSVAIIVTVVFNVFLDAFVTNSSIYKDLSIIDRAKDGANIDLIPIIITMLINICILALICIFTKSIYEKKDIM